MDESDVFQQKSCCVILGVVPLVTSSPSGILFLCPFIHWLVTRV